MKGLSMDYVTILGLIGGTLTTASFFPQVIKAWKTKSMGDVSIGMFLILTAGLLVWDIYGFLIGSLPVVAANTVSFILSVIILVFKVKYG